MKNCWSATVAASLSGLVGCADFFDAATAIADDVQTGVAQLERSNAPTITVVHAPTPDRGGCPYGYRVQLTANSALVVWCRAQGSATESVSSHTTTYHLNFVDVPETTILDKDAGQPLMLDIAAGAGKPVVTRVR